MGIWLLFVVTPMENGYQWSKFGVEVVDGLFVSLVNGNSSSINTTWHEAYSLDDVGS